MPGMSEDTFSCKYISMIKRLVQSLRPKPRHTEAVPQVEEPINETVEKYDTLKDRYKSSSAYKSNACLSLPMLLRYPSISIHLLQFCKKEFNSENLKFYIAVENFNDASAVHLAIPGSNNRVLIDAAFRIYEQFLQDNAPDWVCIEPEVSRTIKNEIDSMRIKNCFNPVIFNWAQAETKWSIEKDALPRYCQEIHQLVLSESFKQSETLREVVEDLLIVIRDSKHERRKSMLKAKKSSCSQSSVSSSRSNKFSVSSRMRKKNSSLVTPHLMNKTKSLNQSSTGSQLREDSEELF